MVFPRRTRHGQPVHSFAKGTGKSLAALVLFLAALSCSQEGTKPAATENSTLVTTVRSSAGLRLTSAGTNQGGRFSPDGRRVLFVSSQREQHNNAQLYELSLDTFRERRVTYHDGDCWEGDYAPDGRRLLYASTTDELKDHPILLNPRHPQRPPTELYLSDPRGMQIERLTHQEGYQGQTAWVSPREILFVAEATDRLRIEAMALPSGRISVWREDKNANLRSPTVDTTGTRTAWIIEKKDSLPFLGLKLNHRIRSLALPFDQVQSLQWFKGANDKTFRILMSASRKGDKALSAWVLDPDQECATSLIREDGSLKDLRASPDREKLLFTYVNGGNPSQVYMREFPPIPNECASLTSLMPAATPEPPAAPVSGSTGAQSSGSTPAAADPAERPKTP